MGIAEMLIYMLTTILYLRVFKMLCIIHKYIYHRNMLPKIYHKYFILITKFTSITLEIKNLHLPVVNLSFASKNKFKGSTL